MESFRSLLEIRKNSLYDECAGGMMECLDIEGVKEGARIECNGTNMENK